MTNPWLRVRFSLLLGVFTLLDVVIYGLYMLARIDTREYPLLNWFIVLTSVILLFSYLIEPFTLEDAPPSKITGGIVLAGLVSMMFLQFGLSMVFELVHKFSFLDNNWLAIFLGVHVAIFEEIMRFSLLRVLGGWNPGAFLPGIAQHSLVQRAIPVLVVNTFWTGYHAISYQNAALQVWLGLWASGLIITYAMYQSQSLLVAVLIHAGWNIMVTLQLSTLIIQALGAVVMLL